MRFVLFAVVYGTIKNAFVIHVPSITDDAADTFPKGTVNPDVIQEQVGVRASRSRIPSDWLRTTRIEPSDRCYGVMQTL